jgi:hypothetical protein
MSATTVHAAAAGTGYVHRDYARSLSEFGTPQLLPACEGWVLVRAVPGSSYRDAMGCYPLFACTDWSALPADLADLDADLVCLALVTDPFADNHSATWQRAFPDVCVPFKSHFVVDLGRAPNSFVSAHHRRNIRTAARHVDVEVCADPTAHATEWIALYANLIARHGIRGIPAFSPRALTEQLHVPGLVMLRAVHRGDTVGMTLWYRQGDAAYYHLGACTDLGYRLRASFSLHAFALTYFAPQLAWLNLGAGAGTRGSGSSGLARFKSGWATSRRTAYFCGRILNAARYHELARAKSAPASHYFPSYRDGEFA